MGKLLIKGRDKEKQRKYTKDYARKYLIRTTVGGKPFCIRANKRLRPADERCELCGNKPKRLHYHHWDDEKPSLGVWVCFGCHMAVEKFEHDIINRYIDLKERVIEKAIEKEEKEIQDFHKSIVKKCIL